MRLVSAMVLVGLVALPLRAKAQVDQEGTIPKPTSAALFVHGRGFLPPQLMLQARYYYDVDVDPLGAQPTGEPATEAGQPKKRLSRGARIAIGVTVPIVVLGAGVGIAAALSPGLSVEVQP